MVSSRQTSAFSSMLPKVMTSSAPNLIRLASAKVISAVAFPWKRFEFIFSDMEFFVLIKYPPLARSFVGIMEPYWERKSGLYFTKPVSAVSIESFSKVPFHESLPSTLTLSVGSHFTSKPRMLWYIS